MPSDVASLLATWESFFVITGGAAAVLIGLQFVAITLSTERQPRPGTSAAARTFGTPTIVHFCVVLLIADSISLNVAFSIALCGRSLCGTPHA